LAAKVSSGRKSAHSGWNLCIISCSSILIHRAPDAISGMPAFLVHIASAVILGGIERHGVVGRRDKTRKYQRACPDR
jgi:hypothetical protein